MTKLRYSPEVWQARRRVIDDWDAMFADGRWSYLGSLGESPRYAMIAGYIHHLISNASVLDVGCGEGVLAQYLDHSRTTYVGADLSKHAIVEARKRYPHGQFLIADAQNCLQQIDDSYDAIIFNEVLPHVVTPFELLDAYLGCLQPDGFVIISTYCNVDPESSAAIFSDMLAEEIHRGRYKILASSEVTSSEHGLRWQIMVLRPPETGDPSA